MSPLALLGLGLALGIRHATDPDHVVAVMAISSRTRRWLPAAGLGAVWGLGHTLTLFVVGALIILFNLAVPPRVGLALELAVAIALIAVGALNLGHRHRHHDGDAGPAGATPPPLPAARAFVVGLLHGLAGSAAVALLVLSLIHDPLWACGYLLVFGVGTLIGMVLVTTGFAAPFTLAARRWPGLDHGIRFATGTLSIAFGMWLAWQIGVVDGLFTTTPHWTPQ